MGFGGALSFSGLDATIAAGVAAIEGIGGIPATISLPISAGAPCDGGVPVPGLEVSFAIPPMDDSLNVTINGFSMTVEADGFGDLDIIGDISLSNPLCNPPSIGFEVPSIATISNVTCNGINVAIPGVEVDIAPIVDPETMAMQTPQTNVTLYW